MGPLKKLNWMLISPISNATLVQETKSRQHTLTFARIFHKGNCNTYWGEDLPPPFKMSYLTVKGVSHIQKHDLNPRYSKMLHYKIWLFLKNATLEMKNK